MEQWSVFEITIFILVVILAVLFAGIILRAIVDRCKKESKPDSLSSEMRFGGSESSETEYYAGVDTAVSDVYHAASKYIEEVGSDKHLIDYLAEIYDMKQLKISDTIRSMDIKYKELYQLLTNIAELTSARTSEELIEFAGIRYLWFVPEAKKRIVLDSYRHDVDIKSDVKEKIKQYAGVPLLDREVDQLMKRLLLHLRTYYKLKAGYSSKSAAKIKKLGARSFELDIMGASPVIRRSVIAFMSHGPKSISEKLREVDLAAMRAVDPYAVSSFLRRIKDDYELRNITKPVDTMRNMSLLADLEHKLSREENRRRMVEDKLRYRQPSKDYIREIKEAPWSPIKIGENPIKIEKIPTKSPEPVKTFPPISPASPYLQPKKPVVNKTIF